MDGGHSKVWPGGERKTRDWRGQERRRVVDKIWEGRVVTRETRYNGGLVFPLLLCLSLLALLNVELNKARGYDAFFLSLSALFMPAFCLRDALGFWPGTGSGSDIRIQSMDQSLQAFTCTGRERFRRFQEYRLVPHVMLLLKTRKSRGVGQADICGAAVAHALCEATHSRVSTLSSRVSLVSPATPSSRDHHHHVSFMTTTTATRQRSSLISSLTVSQTIQSPLITTHNKPPPHGSRSLTTSTSPHNPRAKTALNKNGRRRPLHLPTRRPQGTPLFLIQSHPIPSHHIVY